ncbi:hypothetical protein Tco_0081149 [Tanacetum coccineum]
MDNVRPRSSSSSPIRFFNTKTVDRPKSPKTVTKSKWVKKESTDGIQAVLLQTKGEKGSVVTSPTQTWRPKGAYLDHRLKNNGSYKLKKFEYGNPEEELKDHAIIDSGCSGSMTCEILYESNLYQLERNDGAIQCESNLFQEMNCRLNQKDSNYLIHSYRVVCFETFRYSIYTIKTETGGLDDGVAASFQRSRIHKPHAYTQAFKVNHSTSK